MDSFRKIKIPGIHRRYRPHFAFPFAAWYGVMPRAHENNKTDIKRANDRIFFIKIKSKSGLIFFDAVKYKKKPGNKSRPVIFLIIFSILFHSLFLNPCALTASLAEEIQFRTAHFTYFMQLNTLDIW